MIIKRITSTDRDVEEQLNPLLDPGTVWNAQQGERFLADSNNALFLAYVNAEAVGFVTAHRLQRFDQRQAEVLLYEIGVDEQYRRQGIGKALLQAVKDWAKEVGADEVWVLTNKSNTAAMALYTSLGGKAESDDEQMLVIKI